MKLYSARIGLVSAPPKQTQRIRSQDLANANTKVALCCAFPLFASPSRKLNSAWFGTGRRGAVGLHLSVNHGKSVVLPDGQCCCYGDPEIFIRNVNASVCAVPLRFY